MLCYVMHGVFCYKANKGTRIQSWELLEPAAMLIHRTTTRSPSRCHRWPAGAPPEDRLLGPSLGGCASGDNRSVNKSALHPCRSMQGHYMRRENRRSMHIHAIALPGARVADYHAISMHIHVSSPYSVLQGVSVPQLRVLSVEHDIHHNVDKLLGHVPDMVALH
jgi:hypothetical protein